MPVADFTFGVRLSLVFIIQSSFLSIISVSALLGYAAFYSIRNLYRPPAIGRRTPFFRNSLDYLFLSLLFWDLILALGAAMNIRWVHDATITTGAYCTTQGVFKHIGAVGVAFFTAAIAIYTFLVIFMRWQLPTSRWLPLTVIGLITIFLILLPTIGSRMNTDPPFYGPSTYWCWIDPEYYYQRLGLEYGLAWLTAFLNIVLYVPLFFVLRGNIQVDLEQSDPTSKGKRSFSWARNRRDGSGNQEQEGRKESLAIAKQMLAYPIAYIILILPMSLVRWIEPNRSSTNPLPSAFTGFAGIIYSSSGLVNVLLYVLTRPALLPSWRACRRRNGDSKRKRQDAGHNTGTYSEDGRVGAMPEMTMLSYSETRAPARINPVAPPSIGAPMLADSDDTDDEGVSPSHDGIHARTGGSSSSHSRPNALAVPKPTYRSSWGSTGNSSDKYDSHSQENSGYSSSAHNHP